MSLLAFTGKNHHRRRKSTAKFTRTASLRPLAITSGPGRQLEAFHLKNEAPTGARGRADLRETSVLRKAFSGKLAASNTTWTLMVTHRRPHIYTIA
jgi:hypothetical protein